MPNWCYQDLLVIGPKSEIERLHNEMRITEDGKEFMSLNHFFPCPQELVDTPSAWYADPDEQARQAALEDAMSMKHGFKNWYDWCVANWGTKWGACSVDASMNVGRDADIASLTGHFESAWAPATGLLERVSALFPTLVFGISFTEESSAFAGYTVWRGGTVVSDVDWEPKCPERNENEDEDSYEERFMDWQSEEQGRCQSMMTSVVTGQVAGGMSSSRAPIHLA
jgi:hypothetical protein